MTTGGVLPYEEVIARASALLELPAPDRGALTDGVLRYLGLYEDLSFDSLQIFQLVIVAEALADADVPPAEPVVIETLDDVYSYYLACARQGAG